MSGIPERVLNLSDEKRALYKQRLTGRSAGLAAVGSIPLRPDQDSCPLSFAQERLWFLDQLGGGGAVYNRPAALRLVGPLNTSALQQGLNEILIRHEILRSTFSTVEGRAVQAIAPPRPLNIPFVDLSDSTDDEAERRAIDLAVEEASRPFDFTSGQMLRAILIRLSADDHILSLVSHHLVFDGWSMGVLLREFGASYECSCKGETSTLKQLPIQYADFADWQRHRLQGELLEKQLDYWKRQLDQSSALQLPTDRPRPAVQTFRGAHHFRLLPERLVDSLKSFSRNQASTPFMVLLACFKVLLYRYCDQEDIIVGTLIAGRTRTETENLIGPFINTLVLRTDLSGDPSFSELTARIRKVSLGAYDHQDLPFEKLIEGLQPRRDLSRHPLFQVMFSLENVPSSHIAVGDLTVSQIELDNRTSKLDLSFEVVERAEGMTCCFEYNTDLFEASTITRMLGHFETLLEAALASPWESISRLRLLTDVESHQLRAYWNDTPVEHPQNRSITELFESQVEKTPERVAFIFERETLGYREMNRRSNQLAQYLRTLGVGPGVLVGLCLERSPDLAIALLAVLKAGGSYLPLDPAYPQKHLAYMLADSGASIVLSTGRFRRRLTETNASVVYLDSEHASISRFSQENLENLANPESPAYVIYTSGSTGKPKGVRALQKQILNRLFWMWDNYPFEPDEVCCQKTAFSFVDSIWELLGPLLKGVPTVIVAEDVVRDPREFVRVLSEHRVTRLWLVPSLLQVILDTQVHLETTLQHLRFWVTTGEAVSVELFKRFQEAMPQSILFNLYGTSEVWDATWFDPRSYRRELSSIPIGRPISNVRTYVLDRNVQPVPIGVVGELCVGGAGVASGYVNRPDLTDEKFIPDPFDSDSSARIYKTGDLARFLPDGNLEFIGRRDNQVKINGFRIEMGEIEEALNCHPSVRHSVVIVRQSAEGDRRLIAYLVARQTLLPSTDEITQYLQERLPEHMIPSAFVPLDGLPLTPSGKVAREMLSPVPDIRIEEKRDFISPRSAIEFRLARIWEQCLGKQSIGVRDNFFEAGGHSLLAMRLFAEIETTFGRILPLSILFQAPTIEKLAAILGEQENATHWSSLVPIQSGGSRPPLFCVHAAGREVLFYRDLARHLGVDQPFLGLRERDMDHQGSAQSWIEVTASHYIEEICSVQSDGPYHLGGYSFGGVVAFEIAQQLRAQGKEVGLLALIDTYGTGYLTDLPILQKFVVHSNNLWRLPRNEKLNYAAERGKAVRRRLSHRISRMAKKIWPSVDRPVIQTQHSLGWDVYRQIRMAYRPKVYPGRITLFRAGSQPVGYYDDPLLGWGGLAAGGFETYEVPGNHLTILGEPGVQTLAEQLIDCLARASKP